LKFDTCIKYEAEIIESGRKLALVKVGETPSGGKAWDAKNFYH
jgi:hypothetical protein